MPPLLQLQKIPWKGDGGWKRSVFELFYWLRRRSRVSEKKKRKKKKKKRKKMRFGASYSTSNKLLLPDTF